MAKVTYQDCQKITTIKQEIILARGVKGCGVQALQLSLCRSISWENYKQYIYNNS